MTLASSAEKNTGPTPGPWMIVPPGGPQGPFYGLINSRGNVVATQIVGEANVRLIAAAPQMLDFIRQVALFSNDASLARTAAVICRDVAVSEPELAP